MKFWKSFIFLSLLLSLISYLYFGFMKKPGGDNLSFIIKKAFIENPETEELFFIMTSQKMAEKHKKVDVQKLIVELRKKLEEKNDFFKESYTKRYSPKEIRSIRKLLENSMYERYKEDHFEITKESLQQVNQILDQLLNEAESAESKEGSSEIQQVTAVNFEQEVIHSPIPVILDFYADWCAPCKAVEVILDPLSKEFSGKVKFLKIDSVSQKEIAEKFKVKDLPVILFIKDGKIKERQSGFADSDTLREKIQALLK